MCTSNEDCVEFVAIKDKNRVQIRLMPYGGIMQYTLPQETFSGSLKRPKLSYLLGINVAVSSKRWMSSISGIVDLSFQGWQLPTGLSTTRARCFHPSSDYGIPILKGMYTRLWDLGRI